MLPESAVGSQDRRRVRRARLCPIFVDRLVSLRVLLAPADQVWEVIDIDFMTPSLLAFASPALLAAASAATALGSLSTLVLRFFASVIWRLVCLFLFCSLSS